MARVITLRIDPAHPKAEIGLGGDDTHAIIMDDCWRTVCGVQLEGDDGVGGVESNGVVTCALCIRIIEQIKALRSWKPKT